MSTVTAAPSFEKKSEAFSIPQARAILHDLFEHNAWIYWTDMLVMLTLGYGSAVVYLDAPDFSLKQFVSLAVAAFALFRVGSFIHEIVHFRSGEMQPFTIAWNILAGIPMLMPSFFYSNHIDHHNTQHYGTSQDGEYLPLGTGSLGTIAAFFMQIVFLPAWAVFRFAILTPISFLHPRLRKWALESQSSYVLNRHYRRRDVATGRVRVYWAMLDILCSIRTIGIFFVVLNGTAEWQRLPRLYVLAMCVLGLNYIRNLVAHHYEGDGTAMSHADQFRDSVNITGVPVLTELFFPLNLRFHALHHLFPGLPYHNLRKAHQRLLRELPSDSEYHQSVYPGFFAVAFQVLGQALRGDTAHRQRSAAWFERRREYYRQRADRAA